VAEALAMKGVPFRTAYQAVGKLVRRCQELKLPLAQATAEIAQAIDPRFDADVLQALDPRNSVARKQNAGGTGPASVLRQIEELSGQAKRAQEAAAQVPRLARLFEDLKEAAL
jgi:argininosuccinate lyase